MSVPARTGIGINEKFPKGLVPLGNPCSVAGPTWTRQNLNLGAHTISRLSFRLVCLDLLPSLDHQVDLAHC
jgi:hypothetical protein